MSAAEKSADGNVEGRAAENDRDAHAHAHRSQPCETPDPLLGAFYYPWYGAPETDGAWSHWNHARIAHWAPREAEKWPKHAHM